MRDFLLRWIPISLLILLLPFLFFGLDIQNGWNPPPPFSQIWDLLAVSFILIIINSFERLRTRRAEKTLDAYGIEDYA